MAVGYKLATRGVLGSDMYAGFFGGDQHHFETLPLQHVLEALSFTLLGPGIAQARVVSVLAAIALAWSVGWLTFRWYGPAAAGIAELLLVAWRSDLTAAWTGLPLFGVARTARYDVLAVAFAWLAIAALDLGIRRPRATQNSGLLGLLTGILTGLATLSQFFGAFVLPVVFFASGRRSRRLCLAVLAGVTATLLPYAIYAARYFADARGQLSVFGDRFQIGLDSLIAEPGRYRHLIEGQFPGSPWLLVIGLFPALAYVGWRSREPEAVGERLLVLSTLCFGVGLALLDSTKASLYAVLLLPSICISLAAAAVALMKKAWRSGAIVRVASAAAAGIIAVSLAADSVAAYKLELSAADEVTPYLSYGQRIESFIEPGAAILGPEAWWWALHDHPYTSLRSLWFQWSATAHETGLDPNFVDLVTRGGAQQLIVNQNVRNDIRAFPQALQQQFWTFMDHCTSELANFDDANYRVIEIYQINQTCTPH